VRGSVQPVLPRLPRAHGGTGKPPGCPNRARLRRPDRPSECARLPGAQGSEGNVDRSGPEGKSRMRLQAFLLFLYFSFSPRLLLLSLGPRAAATAERAPFTGLHLAAEVHRAAEQDDDPDDARHDRVPLPPGLPHAPRFTGPVLRPDPAARLRRARDV